jgi:hypothetical protein
MAWAHARCENPVNKTRVRNIATHGLASARGNWHSSLLELRWIAAKPIKISLCHADGVAKGAAENLWAGIGEEGGHARQRRRDPKVRLPTAGSCPLTGFVLKSPLPNLPSKPKL